MDWYYDAKPTIRTDQGIKARSKRGDFVKNWWASRWIQAMERVMDKGRLTRGRSYARKGQVLDIDISPGVAAARVQGSRRTPYKAAIKVELLTEQHWEKVVDALSERPLFVAQLLSGEMPQEIEEAFAAVGVSLFPLGAAELNMSCSCPDWSSVCKHLAAVHYILAERFDEDPFLLFTLRGKPQNDLLKMLRDRNAADEAVALREEGATYVASQPLGELLDSFWQIGEEATRFATHVSNPTTPMPILERLGQPDFMEESLRQQLGPIYTAVTVAAVKAAFEEDDSS